MDIDLIGKTRRSNEKAMLSEIYQNIGPAQVTSSAIDFEPSWVTQRTMKKYHDNNWREAYEEVKESNLPGEAKIVTSHEIFKVKMDEDG